MTVLLEYEYQYKKILYHYHDIKIYINTINYHGSTNEYCQQNAPITVAIKYS